MLHHLKKMRLWTWTLLCVLISARTVSGQGSLLATECKSETPAISNGYVISTGPYYNGSRAAYTCQTGFSMAGIANDVICWDNDWVGTAPLCTEATNTTGDHDHLYVIIAFGVLVGVIFVLFIALACIYVCVRHRNNKFYHLRPLSDGGFKRHVYHNEYLYHRENTKIEKAVMHTAAQTLPGRDDRGTGSARLYYTRSAGTNMERNTHDVGTGLEGLFSLNNIGINTDPPIQSTSIEVQTDSPIPALSIISSPSFDEKPPPAPMKPKPAPPPPTKTAAPRAMWMPHRHPVRNNNTSTR